MTLQNERDALSRYTNTYTTFSGADIVATFSGVTIGTLAGISWSITREKAPVYTMGSPNPRSFSRGKRGLAGALIFTMFDRPSLYRMLESFKNEEKMKFFTRTANLLPGQGGINEARGLTPTDLQSLEVKSAFPYYADQIPPFDVTLTFANEYGQCAKRSIYGIEFLNEGSGASMDDIQIEETMTYVCRDIGPMTAVANIGSDGPSGSELDSIIIP